MARSFSGPSNLVRVCAGLALAALHRNGHRDHESDKTQPTTAKHGIAVSLFDQRYKADQRLDSIELLFGGRRFNAKILNLEMVFNEKTPPASLELKDGTKTMFLGQIRVSLVESGSTLSLSGKMRRAFNASQELVPFEATLACKDMSEFGNDFRVLRLSVSRAASSRCRRT